MDEEKPNLIVGGQEVTIRRLTPEQSRFREMKPEDLSYRGAKSEARIMEEWGETAAPRYDEVNKRADELVGNVKDRIAEGRYENPNDQVLVGSLGRLEKFAADRPMTAGERKRLLKQMKQVRKDFGDDLRPDGSDEGEIHQDLFIQRYQEMKRSIVDMDVVDEINSRGTPSEFGKLFVERHTLQLLPPDNMKQEQRDRLAEIESRMDQMVEEARAKGQLADIDSVLDTHRRQLQNLEKLAGVCDLTRRDVVRFQGDLSSQKTRLGRFEEGRNQEDQELKDIRAHYARVTFDDLDEKANHAFETMPLTFKQIQKELAPIWAKIDKDTDPYGDFSLDELVARGVITDTERHKFNLYKGMLDDMSVELMDAGEFEDTRIALNNMEFRAILIMEASVQGILAKEDLTEFRDQVSRMESALAIMSTVEDVTPGKYKGFKSFVVRRTLSKVDKLTGRLKPNAGVQQGQLASGVEQALLDLVAKVSTSTDAMNAMIKAQREALYGATTLPFEYPIGHPRAGEHRDFIDELDMVREFLEIIESSNRETHDFGISSLVKMVETSMDKMDPKIADEVKTRLAIHDSAQLQRKANGWISRPSEVVGYGFAVGSAAGEAEQRGHDIDRRVVEVFFKNEMGYRTKEAWDLLQDAYFFYGEMSEDMNLNTLLGDSNMTSFSQIDVSKVVDRDTPPDGIDHNEWNSRTNKTPRTLRVDVYRRLVASGFNPDQAFRTELRSHGVTNLDALIAEARRLKSEVVDVLTGSRIDPGTSKSIDIDYRYNELTTAQKDRARIVVHEATLGRLFVTKSLTPFDDDLDLGKEVTNYRTENNKHKKVAVRTYLVSLIGGEDPDKALSLAENIALATLETSVANMAATGNDQLGEIINFRGWRESRAQKSRDSGPRVHLAKIQGFGNSYLRSHTREPNASRTPLYSARIRKEVIDNLREGGYAFHCGVILGKLHSLRGLLLDEDPAPPKTKVGLTKAKLNGLVDYFNKSKLDDIRFHWVAGMVDSALAYPETSDWVREDFVYLEQLLTDTMIGEIPVFNNQGAIIRYEPQSFISHDDWVRIVGGQLSNGKSVDKPRVTNYAGKVSKLMEEKDRRVSNYRPFKIQF